MDSSLVQRECHARACGCVDIARAARALPPQRAYRAAMIRATFAMLAALAACRASTAPPAPASHDAPGFGLYVLALTWAPSFCCGHAQKEECSQLDASFAGTHLTLHGLWPNYTDDESREHHSSYPQFCGAYEHCSQELEASCEPDPRDLPDEMRVLGPGYIGDHEFLARHEWPKHGSCTGLSAAEYFRAAVGAMKALPGEGTPDALHGAIGGDIALAELESSFGVPADSVLLGCNSSCRLEQVAVCLAHDAKGLPSTPVACPANTVRARSDNGCVTRGCTRVAIPQAGQCEVHGKAPGHACDHPGQGPACTSNDECVQAGFRRCARSGCCTSQP